MITLPEQRVQRGHAVAIVDEADTILIDEAMTPLTISGAGGNVTVEYERFARAVRGLVADVDFKVDEERRTIEATKVGLRKIEKRLGAGDLYSDPYGRLLNHLRQALRAQYLFHRDQQYVVEGDEVKIAGELADRTMEGCSTSGTPSAQSAKSPAAKSPATTPCTTSSPTSASVSKGCFIREGLLLCNSVDEISSKICYLVKRFLRTN